MPDRGGATILDDLPDCIVIEEILVRLPPKDILRCRAVRKSWRRATSTHKFMLDNHGHQPPLAVVDHTVITGWDGLFFLYGNAGAGDSSQKLRPFLRRRVDSTVLHAARDGLLIVSHESHFYVCNPAIRKSARIPQPRVPTGFNVHVAGFYKHLPSGEYRVLWVSRHRYRVNHKPAYYYIMTVGSDNPRCITRLSSASLPSVEQALLEGLPNSTHYKQIYHRRNLHWKLGKCQSAASDIMVFDTEAETFRWMHCPVKQLDCRVSLLEMDGTLALCSGALGTDTVDVWVLQDYEAEVWALKCRIDLLALIASAAPLDLDLSFASFMDVINERELLIQFTFGYVLHCDIGGNFLGHLKTDEDKYNHMWITCHSHKESAIPLPLPSKMQEKHVSRKDPPFFIRL